MGQGDADGGSREPGDGILAPGELRTALGALCRITGLGGVIVAPSGRFLSDPIGRQTLCDSHDLHGGGGAAGCLAASVQAVLERLRRGEEPVHRCPTGFINAGVPVVVDGHTSAVLVLGQVFTARPTRAAVERRAAAVGRDPQALVEVFQQIPVVPRGRFDEVIREAAGLTGVFARAFADRLEADRARRDSHLKDDALRHGEDRYRTILDAIQEGYFEMDLDGRCTFANGAMAAMLGRRLPELLGTSCRTYLTPASEEVFTGALRRLYLTGQQVQGVTYEVLLEDGSRRTLELSAALRLDDRGEPSGYRGLVRDVTEREQAQAMSRATLDSQVSHICILDKKGGIRVVNKAWERNAASASGIPHVEVGVNYLDALEHGRQAGLSHAAKEAEGVRAVLEGRRGEFIMEYSLRPQAQEPLWFHLTATPLVVAGTVSGVVLSRRDISERKRGEQELTKVYKAMDSSIDGLALLDTEGAFLYMNPAFAHLYGYDAPVELAGLSWKTLYGEARFQRIETEVLPQLQRVGYWTGELEGRRKDGTSFQQWASLTLAAVEQVIICSVRDIGAQKRAEAAARASQERLKTIFENVMEGILVMDPDGPRILEANNALLRMFGYAPGESLERLDVLGQIVEEDRPRVLEDLRRVIEENYHEPCIYRATSKDGRHLWVQCLGTRTLYNGRPVDLVAISDITYRRETELALLLSEGRLRAVVESAMDAIFIKDRDLVFLDVNPAFAEMFGLSPSEIVGLRHDNLFESEEAARIRASDLRVLAGETVQEEVTKRLRGGQRTLHVIKVPLRDPGGDVVGICGIARDLTERKKAEGELERRGALLAGVAEATGELLSNPDFDAAMRTALGVVGRAVRADHAYVFGRHAHPEGGGPVFSQLYEWTNGRVEPKPNNADLQNIDVREPAAQRWIAAAESGRAVSSLTADLPAEERAFLQSQGVRSVLAVPVRTDEGWWGFIGFDDCTEERRWLPHEEAILEALAASVSGAIQRRTAEETLRRSEEAFRHIVENAPEFYFYVHDVQGRFTYISPSVEAVTGYPPDYFMGPHAPITTDSPLNLDGELAAESVLRGEEPPPYRFEVQHRDGRILTLECHERPLKADGKVVEVLGLCHNITGRIEMERTIRESEERFRFLVENAPNSFFYIQNVDMSYAYISPTVEAVTGYTAEYLLEPHPTIMTDNPLNEEGRAMTKRILREGITPAPYRAEIRHRDGMVRMLETCEQPILKDGQVVGLLGMLRDITDQLALEEELARYRRLEIAGCLSPLPARQAREPLYAIGVTLEALRRKIQGQAEIQPYLDILAEQSRRLADLLKDVADLAPQVDPARMERRRMSALVGDALDMLERSAPEAASAMSFSTPDRPSCAVMADGRSVVQALLGILKHVASRSSGTGSVGITIAAERGLAVVRVSDDGPALDAEALAGAFSVRSGSEEDSGLGMAVAGRVAEEHGGRAWAEKNAPGPGCTFAFALPLAPAEGWERGPGGPP